MIIYFLRTKLSALAALFEEASKCMLSLPGLAGPSILAFIALIIFLAFWLIVVVCLATANYPGMKQLLPFNEVQPIDNSTVSTMRINNNTAADYKCLFASFFKKYFE